MSSDEDEARLLAALSLAFRSVTAEGRSAESFEARLDQLGKAMIGQRWQITVARDLKLSIGTWLSRPWHCWKLRKLVRALLVENLDPSQERDFVDLLTRCAAMVEFGVDVNATWYRRLREAVAEEHISSRELRSLLNRATVWWGTPNQSPVTWRSPMSWITQLWSMGRPSGGELLVTQHRWTTKFLLVNLLVLSGFALGVVTVGFASDLVARGSTKGMGPTIVAIYTYGTIAWAAWWFGPHSWAAVRRLREVLRISRESSQ